MSRRKPLTLAAWWADPTLSPVRNPYVVHSTPTGAASVYVYRSQIDPRVLHVASINTISGWGAARHLYRTFCRDIPTIAEQILNPNLDKWLSRIGWTQAYYDLAEIPTRVNKAFMEAFPDAASLPNANLVVYRAAKGALA